MCTDSSKNGEGKKLRSDVVIHSGLVKQNSHFPKKRKVFMFRTSRLMEMSLMAVDYPINVSLVEKHRSLGQILGYEKFKQ